MKKILNICIAVLFTLNNMAYALGPDTVSGDPVMRQEMYAGANQRWREKVGPGGTWLDRMRSKLQRKKFIGEKPDLEDMNIFSMENDKKDLQPFAWSKNPILEKTDLIEALEYFRDNEALIPKHLLEIREVYYELDEEKGKLPLPRIETYKQSGGTYKYVLAVHTKFVQMWNHIRENDIVFQYQFRDHEFRDISLAWGIFYRLAKHEMADLKHLKDGLYGQKGGGHVSNRQKLGFADGIIGIQENETFTNLIGGRYKIINDSIWLWFLQSYCFYDSTRYNNHMFRKRLDWIFDDVKDGKFVEQFTNLMVTMNDPRLLTFTKKLAQAINFHFFSREGIKVPELTVAPNLIKEYEERKAFISGYALYAGGGNLEIIYSFTGAALTLAKQIKQNMQKKADELSALIGQKAFTELPEELFPEMREILSPHWVTDEEFDGMAVLAGDAGRAYCSQVAREIRMPFELIEALKQSEREANKEPLTNWLLKVFGRVQTKELNINVVVMNIMKQYREINDEAVFEKTPKAIFLNKAFKESMQAVVEKLSAEQKTIGAECCQAVLSVMSSGEQIQEQSRQAIDKKIKAEESVSLENLENNFSGQALTLAKQIKQNMHEKTGKLKALIEYKLFTELDENIILKIKQELDSHWVTDEQFDEMVRLAGDAGKAFCKQLPREARMPFELIEALKEAEKQQSPEPLKKWLLKIFERVETKELTAKVVVQTILKISGGIQIEAYFKTPEAVTLSDYIVTAMNQLLEELKETSKTIGVKYCQQTLSLMEEEKQLLVDATDSAKKIKIPDSVISQDFEKDILKRLREDAGETEKNSLKHRGPGVITPMDEKKRKRAWQGVNSLLEDNIEILIPKSIMLSKDFKKKLIETKKIMGKKGNIFLWKRYGDEDVLKKIRKNKGKVKKIVLTDEKTSLMINALLEQENNVEAFRNVRVLNVQVPQIADDIEKTKYQMHLFMTAILARLLEPGDKYFADISVLLSDMLEGCFQGKDVKVNDFISMLVQSEDKRTSVKKIKERIQYFLTDIHAISLIEKLQVDWELSQEFYKYL
ncbi:MAG: hypothetical protein ABH869_02650 [Candidatus Omnitrophota bacterium]